MSLVKPLPIAHTLRALAWLLAYPDADHRAALPALRDALHAERALTFGRLAEIDRLIDHLMDRSQGGAPLAVEAEYVELFDRGRATALHLFEHVHGDSRDRGPAMVDLERSYLEAGLLLADGELPDHLGVVLEYASTQPPAAAREFLREFAHILQNLFSALLQRESIHASAYAGVMAALLDLAGEKACAVALPAQPGIDETWSEPAAFGGCSSAGQAQPIRLQRRPPQGARA
ncbi:MAG: nitrate reductase molybdenum cofactor assembly chaperone [Burkholderiales bacterium]|nr:nitrate reductase molybdenum cofactor assembly chaperone [Burkholderiales bacterium]